MKSGGIPHFVLPIIKYELTLHLTEGYLEFNVPYLMRVSSSSIIKRDTTSHSLKPVSPTHI
jgi:hypothetical protein